MQILLSPAKTMTGQVSFPAPSSTKPQFEQEAKQILSEMSQWSIEDLKQELKLSPKLAFECHQRIQASLFPEQKPLPALLAYTGVVFKHIHPQDFSESEFQYAQAHLRIVSTAYGLLRALDGIKPYRLEYDVKLPETTTSSLYSFWKERQTDTLINDIKADDGILLNLASKDVQPAFDWKKVAREIRIITPEFFVRKDGKPKTVVIYAKMLRGEMARHIIKHQLDSPDSLKAFEWEGFRFREDLSTDDRWHFEQ